MIVIETKEQFQEMLKPVFFNLMDEYFEKKTKNGLDSKEAAEYLGITAGTFYNWVSDGKIKPSYHIGNKPIYTKEDLDELKT